MVQFDTTVSQLKRAQLVSAADEFQLDNTGTVVELRKRIKDHIEANLDYMDNPNYARLFPRHQRLEWEARSDHNSPSPPPGGELGGEENDSHRSQSPGGHGPPPPNGDGDEDDQDPPPANDLTDSHEAQLEFLKHLPPAILNKAIGALFNGE
ncbi:hypothetical protein R3P38DRAFT_3425598 [Favolaschia claudopus]|uniref:SAP30-binding protein n=1 Tax=Favolaschia claudopus TaxID=2862362 RepID=A0AAV9ZXP0_9AGAR